ncbi:MAG: hypothetical protein ACE5KM_21240 [Planctomycetaceae bacterium]
MQILPLGLGDEFGQNCWLSANLLSPGQVLSIVNAFEFQVSMRLAGSREWREATEILGTIAEGLGIDSRPLQELGQELETLTSDNDVETIPPVEMREQGFLTLGRIKSVMQNRISDGLANHGRATGAVETLGAVPSNRIPTGPEPAASSTMVFLYTRNDGPVVRGNEKQKLTVAQYDVVLALLKAGETGLTKDTLDKKSGHTDARKILKRLTKKDDDWDAAIPFPGGSGKGYRIL